MNTSDSVPVDPVALQNDNVQDMAKQADNPKTPPPTKPALTGRRRKDQRRSTRYGARPFRYRGGWRIGWTDASGKRHSRAFPLATYGEKAHEEAQQELNRLRGELQAIKDGRAPRPTQAPKFGSFFDKYWIPNRAKDKRSADSDKSIYRSHLKDTFADLPMNQITTAKIESFRAGLKNEKASATAKPDDDAKHELKANTVRNILGLLGAVLRYAHSLGLIFAVPTIKKPKTYIKQFSYLKTEKEIQAFLSEAKKIDVGAYALFATAVYSGLRAGELFGLKWRDVDFTKRLITVSRSFDSLPKGGHVRYVPLFDVLLPILREWRLQNKNDLCFPNEAGNMHTRSPRVVKETYPKALKEAKLPRIRFHDLRHTFASHWVMKGGDLFTLQKILGHSSQAMTQRYAHLAPDAFERFRGIFGNKPPKTEDAEVFDAAKARDHRSKKK